MNHFLGRFLGLGRNRGRVWGLLLWSAAVLSAQPLAFRHFDDRDGLPQSQVTAILEDREGFIWMGTVDGLARLGASGFRPYRAQEGLRPTQVNCLIQDRQGSIWVGGQESGVAEVRGSRVQNFGEAEGLKVTTIYSLLESREGEILAGARQGLFRKKGDRFERVELPDPWKYLPVFALAEDSEGGLWMGSRKGNLFRWDGKKVEAASLPKTLVEKAVQSLVRDSKGNLWALFPESLLRLNRDGVWLPHPLPPLPGHPIFSSLSFSREGELLLAMGTDGLLILGANDHTQIWTYKDGLPREGVLTALRDRRGVLWIGTDGSDALAQTLSNLRVLDINPETGVGMGLGTITSFLELPGGQVLLGGARGLFLWGEGRGIVSRWQSAPGSATLDIWSLIAHPKGGAWVGSQKGLWRWRDGHIEAGPRELQKIPVQSLLLHSNRLWACTTGEGLAELSPEGHFLAFHPLPQEVGKGNVPKVIPYGSGLLVATPVGLYTFENKGGKGSFQRAFEGAPFQALNISTVYEEPSGQLWVATSQGLYTQSKGESRRWTHFGSREANIEGTSNWVCRLPSGQLAVGHAKGVSIVSDEAVTLLTKNRGLLSDETTSDAAMLDSHRRLWIGMKGGVCILDTRDPLKETHLPKPMVMEVAWGTGSSWLPERVTLPPRPGILNLVFDTGFPAPPVVPKYQVMIEGLDRDWRGVEANSTSTQVANIDPGNYVFRVRASLNGREWVESNPLPIRVQPAWYQRSTVRMVFLMMGIGIIVLLVHWRLRTLQRRARALETKIEERTEMLALRNKSLERLHHQLKHSLEGRIQLMRTVSHDLRSPLTSIMLSVDRLRESGGGQVADARLNVLDREARRMEAIIRGLLDQAKSESLTESLNQRLCHPSEVLEGLTDTLQLKAEARELSTHLELDPRVNSVWILADTTALQQVLFNLIENALKFTDPPGTIGIRSILDENTWILEVWDTGRGIDPSQQENIFRAFRQTQEGDEQKGWGLGLSICKALVDAHSGCLEIVSELGQGAIFRVILPLVMPTKKPLVETLEA